jgi:hypothetical protein
VAKLGRNPRRGKTRIPAAVGAGGGVGVAAGPPAHKPSPKPGGGLGITLPPFLSDPSVQAEREAAQRGEHDKLAGIKTETHFARNDLATALRNIHIKASQRFQDIGHERQEAQRKVADEESKLNNQEGKLQTEGARDTEDFSTKLREIGNQFRQLGHSQTEAANASGVLDSGTQAASQAARAQNQQRTEEPVHTAQKREGEDLATALRELGESRSQLSSSAQADAASQALEETRLKEARDIERQESHRDTKRKLFELGREAKQTVEEGKAANIDALLKQIWEARETHPGAFASWAKQHSGIVGRLKSQAPGAGNSGGGTGAPAPNRQPNNNRRRRR